MKNPAEKAAIVYTKNGGLYVENRKWYTSKGRAAAAMRKATKYDGSPKYPEGDYEVLTISEYRKLDVMVETRNILNPDAGVIMIRLSQKGSACDPGTERYHSM